MLYELYNTDSCEVEATCSATQNDVDARNAILRDDADPRRWIAIQCDVEASVSCSHIWEQCEKRTLRCPRCGQYKLL